MRSRTGDEATAGVEWRAKNVLDLPNAWGSTAIRFSFQDSCRKAWVPTLLSPNIIEVLPKNVRPSAARRWSSAWSSRNRIPPVSG
jgi:hypothetical protein